MCKESVADLNRQNKIIEFIVLMNISKELMKGSTSMLVLSVISNEDMYGYKIIRELERRSQNEFQMSEGTLYPILHALEKEKMLESYWQEFEGRNRKYYRITKKGLKELAKKKEEFEAFSASVKKVLNYA